MRNPFRRRRQAPRELTPAEARIAAGLRDRWLASKIEIPEDAGEIARGFSRDKLEPTRTRFTGQ